MPELPEVETIAAGVHARVHGARITAVWTSGKPQTFKSPEHEIAAALTGARIESVRRVGKTIVMTVQRNKASTELLIHLGMTGRLLVSAPELPLAPHTHAVLTLSGALRGSGAPQGIGAPRETAACEIRFVDPRRFGRISLHTATQLTTHNLQLTTSSYSGPGREPLTISLPDFIALFHPRHTPIKAALLNQSLLHGIGNIYADESLFRAAIRPTRQAARLTRAELARLRTALVQVLRHAITPRRLLRL